jgi:probable HAF family extracellular repeat protein
MLGVALAAAAAGDVAISASGACPPEYTYEMACAPPCGPFLSSATGLAINEAGDVVGFANGFCYGERAILWPAGSSTLQFLPMPPGTYSSRAYGINDKGQIVGTWVHPTDPGSGGFMIDNGVFIGMGTLPGGNWSEAYDVNDDGVAVGEWGNNVLGPGSLAMSFAEGVMTDLTPWLELLYTKAYGINESGQIAGFLSPKTEYDARAFILSGDDLTVLPPIPGGLTSAAFAINGLGQVAGWGVVPCDPPERFCGRVNGFLWDGTQMVLLGTLPSYPNVRPYGLNDAGQIVGYMEELNNSRAFLWENGELRILDDLVPGFDGVNIGATSAYGINSSGQVAGRVGSAAGGCALRLTPKLQRPADLDCDGAVGSSDLAILLQSWGAKDSPADLDKDGGVDAADLTILLSDWGG